MIVDIEGGETAEALMAEDADEVWEPVGTVPADTAALDVGGKSAVLMEQSSGDILFEKNPHEKNADRLGDQDHDAAAGDGGAR